MSLLVSTRSIQLQNESSLTASRVSTGERDAAALHLPLVAAHTRARRSLFSSNNAYFAPRIRPVAGPGARPHYFRTLSGERWPF